MKAAFDNQAHLRSRANEKSQEKIEIDALWKRYQAQEKVDLSGEEYERLKLYEPCLWWCKVITILRHYQCSEDHLARCFSCGDSAMTIGRNFRIPKKG